jgi:hypothetical protein
VVLGAKRNVVGDIGAAAIGDVLRQNTVLRRLDLRSNGIGATGKAALVAGLEHNTTLQQLLLDGKPHPRLAQLIQRNWKLHPEPAPQLAPDVALTRSVYRTAIKPH